GSRSPGAVQGRALTSKPPARSASASTWKAHAQGSGTSGSGTRIRTWGELPAKQDARLAGDLGQHWRCHRAGRARLGNQAPELLDSRTMPVDPPGGRFDRV